MVLVIIQVTNYFVLSTSAVSEQHLQRRGICRTCSLLQRTAKRSASSQNMEFSSVAV